MIVDLAEYKLQNGPRLEGTGICLQCKHEWEVVAPIGVTYLQCPQCSLYRGVFKGVCAPEVVWECNCGCRFFYINASGAICSNCGTEQIFGEW